MYESHTEGFFAGIEIVAPAATGDNTRNKNINGFNIYVPVKKQEGVPSLVLVDCISSNRIMFLPVWWKLVGILLFSAIFLYIFSNHYESNQDIAVTWESECNVGKWENKNSSLLLNLTCNGKETQISDSETLLSYINSLKKPRCFTDKGGNSTVKTKINNG